ncbi:MAG: hypothetical protein HYY17_13250 [Planctomycetes bacterium]|nr:hypothetical protein [Planctomycetota bacterium]
MDIVEGEEVLLPCRHCSSVSLKFMVHAGNSSIECPKCGATTAITVVHEAEGWTIHASASAVTGNLEMPKQG